MTGSDLYLRTTDETGVPTYSHHRVWSLERFMVARMNEAAKLNERTGSTRATAVMLPRAQFDAERRGAAPIC